MDPSKSLGPDELHPRVLKELAIELGLVFAHVFQQFIDMGEIPKEWSLAVGLVRPVMEYGSSVWVLLQGELENVQKRTVRFVLGNYSYETGSMTGILDQVKWESLKKGGEIVDS